MGGRVQFTPVGADAPRLWSPDPADLVGYRDMPSASIRYFPHSGDMASCLYVEEVTPITVFRDHLAAQLRPMIRGFCQIPRESTN